MKTPKEKALELVDNFYDKMFYLRDGYNSSGFYETAKKCALIAVDELMKCCDTRIKINGKKILDYLFEVRTEITKL